MTIKILIDMNLSPEWVAALAGHGWKVLHWSSVGDVRAPDAQIMAWALQHGYVVFTHDLDFGTALALTQASGPSVIQTRAQQMLPETTAPLVVAALKKYEVQLKAGALVVIEEHRSQARVLPLQ